jgi:two-component system, NarL family, nitrate/nitrite response regulator NarL
METFSPSKSATHPGALAQARPAATADSPQNRFSAEITDADQSNRPRASRSKKSTRLLLVDDHPIVRTGMAAFLGQQPELEIVGEAADGREALAKARLLVPDLILLDIELPHLNGLAVAEALRKELPQVKVLILSVHVRRELVLRALHAGVRGYVSKDAPLEVLLQGIETVRKGQTYFSPEAARIALSRFVQGNGGSAEIRDLTHCEREVLIHIAEGFSNKEIANKLGRGVRTVETHREHIMRKLDVHTIAGLTRFAVARGLVALGEAVEGWHPEHQFKLCA